MLVFFRPLLASPALNEANENPQGKGRATTFKGFRARV